MIWPIDREDPSERRRLRLSTLNNTRWLAVLGQAATILIVFSYFNFPLPVIECAALIAVSVIVNLVLTWRYPPNQRLEPIFVTSVLAFDIMQLSALLYLTGGLENPFAVLLAVPVLISAVVSPARFTIVLGVLVFIAATFLVFAHLPLPWHPGTELDIPFVYIAGFWSAVIISLATGAVYIGRVARETRTLEDALVETELVLQREMHISALDGLAAAAAHELGTPLATIALVSKEMDRAVSGPPELKDDITLLRSQADRCRDILARLSSLQSTNEHHMTRLPMMTMLEEVVEPHREFGVVIAIRSPSGQVGQPITRRNPAILYGLGNLVENAVDFARSHVVMTVVWNDDTVTIEIMDDGPGFPMEQIERLGEPDIRQGHAAQRARRGGPGLGLGIFIAKTLLERTGAMVRFSNAPQPGDGALVTVSWPRQSVDTFATYDNPGGSRNEHADHA